VVMDNATFHKGGRIEELIQSVGCRLLYLPPYSPDLNRIEQRKVRAGESHPQTIRSGEIVYVMRPLDVLRLASGAYESACYISIIQIKNN